MKPIILTFVRYYLPGYRSGGPARTLANMVDRLGDKLDFRIVTSDRDVGDTKPYPDVKVDNWNRVGKAWVYYASPEQRSLLAFARIMRETAHDVLYVNSFFDVTFSLQPLIARFIGIAPRRPCVIAPRGEFSLGAISLKRWKKVPFLGLARVIGVHRGLAWQASSPQEMADIMRVMGAQAKRIVVAADIPRPVGLLTENAEPKLVATRDVLRVCFLSRISPMKNLDFALRVMQGVSARVVFDIYGPVSDRAYWEVCQRLMKSLPQHVRVQYCGAIESRSVPMTLAQYDLLFLPTRGENYGHVIYEALASGVPVLISDQTPWRGLEDLGVGWDLPLDDVDSFRKVIDKMAVQSAEERSQQRHRAKQYGQRVAVDEEAVTANLSLFTALLANTESERVGSNEQL